MLLRDLLYCLALVALSPMLLYRVIRRGRYRQGWKDRFGFVTPRTTQAPCIWIHGVSMGEINAARSLITRLKHDLPNHDIIISTTTDTGMARAQAIYGADHQVFFFPWDFSTVVRRAFGRLRPDLCIMMEGEVWPNFTALAHKHNIPVVVANGRVGSTKGWPRYQKIAPLVRPWFSRLSLVLAQDDVAAERFQFLGVHPDRCQVVGSVKYDTAEVTDKVTGTDELAASLALTDQPVWVAGQTGPGEEEIILNVFKQWRQQNRFPNLRLVIVPRKPERFDDIAKLITVHGLNLIRYSHIKTNPAASPSFTGDEVILGDTMGDLRKFYSLAQVVFVGRSLVPQGGSDIMEVTALGRTVVVGPHMDNFVETVNVLSQAQAMITVTNPDELAAAIAKLLDNPDYRQSIGQKARQVIIDNQGATDRSVQAVKHLLNR